MEVEITVDLVSIWDKTPVVSYDRCCEILTLCYTRLA